MGIGLPQVLAALARSSLHLVGLSYLCRSWLTLCSIYLKTDEYRNDKERKAADYLFTLHYFYLSDSIIFQLGCKHAIGQCGDLMFCDVYLIHDARKQNINNVHVENRLQANTSHVYKLNVKFNGVEREDDNIKQINKRTSLTLTLRCCTYCYQSDQWSCCERNNNIRLDVYVLQSRLKHLGVRRFRQSDVL